MNHHTVASLTMTIINQGLLATLTTALKHLLEQTDWKCTRRLSTSDLTFTSAHMRAVKRYLPRRATCLCIWEFTLETNHSNAHSAIRLSHQLETAKITNAATIMLSKYYFSNFTVIKKGSLIELGFLRSFSKLIYYYLYIFDSSQLFYHTILFEKIPKFKKHLWRCSITNPP